MRLALLGLAVLLILGMLGSLAVAGFHFWMSSGPPIPQPRDQFAVRAWIDLAMSAAFALGAGIVIWLRVQRGSPA
jgi:hypothetical protein